MTNRSTAVEALKAEIETLGRAPGIEPGYSASLLALARRIAGSVSGFEKIRMLEVLCAKAPHVRLFAEAWTAHYRVGEADLRSAGMLRSGPAGGQQIEVPPRDALALIAAGRMLVRMGRFDEALGLFRRAMALRPADPFAATWEATTLAALGRHDEADARFAAVGEHFPWPCAITRLSPTFWHGLAGRVAAIENAGAASPPDRPDASGVVPPRSVGAPERPPGDGNPVTLVSCDRTYFLRYGEAYVRAWAAQGPRQEGAPAWRVHIHIVGSDHECRAHIAAWRAEGLPVVASEEALPRDSGAFCLPGSAFEVRTFYACARLRVLPRILAYYQAPVLMTDIDLELCAPPEPIWQTLGGADVWLIRFSARTQPLWQEFYLALAAFRPTKTGRRFAAMLAAYVDHFLERKEWIWSLDQTALYSAVGEAERNLQGWRGAALPPDLVVSADRPSDRAVFRHHVASQN